MGGDERSVSADWEYCLRIEELDRSVEDTEDLRADRMGEDRSEELVVGWFTLVSTLELEDCEIVNPS